MRTLLKPPWVRNRVSSGRKDMTVGGKVPGLSKSISEPRLGFHCAVRNRSNFNRHNRNSTAGSTYLFSQVPPLRGCSRKNFRGSCLSPRTPGTTILVFKGLGRREAEWVYAPMRGFANVCWPLTSADKRHDAAERSPANPTQHHFRERRGAFESVYRSLLLPMLYPIANPRAIPFMFYSSPIVRCAGGFRLTAHQRPQSSPPSCLEARPWTIYISPASSSSVNRR